MLKDLHGQSFGRLTVLSRAPSDGDEARWLCRCECGVEVVLVGSVVRRGWTQLCGCSSVASARGGASKHPLYTTWAGMMHRCYNDKMQSFAYYGARGITVCERWHDFGNFIADMGEKPPGTSIDRIDTNGNYEPSNCRWATALEQGGNTRANRPLTLNGETKPLQHWAAELGMPYQTLWSRIQRGWTVEEALSERKRKWSRLPKGDVPQRHMPGLKGTSKTTHADPATMPP